MIKDLSFNEYALAFSMCFISIFPRQIGINFCNGLFIRMLLLWRILISGSKEKGAKESHGDLNDPRVRLKRDCVGTMAAFRLKNFSQDLIIIANTHLYWYVIC